MAVAVGITAKQILGVNRHLEKAWEGQPGLSAAQLIRQQAERGERVFLPIRRERQWPVPLQLQLGLRPLPTAVKTVTPAAPQPQGPAVPIPVAPPPPVEDSSQLGLKPLPAAAKTVTPVFQPEGPAVVPAPASRPRSPAVPIPMEPPPPLVEDPDEFQELSEEVRALLEREEGPRPRSPAVPIPVGAPLSEDPDRIKELLEEVRNYDPDNSVPSETVQMLLEEENTKGCKDREIA